MLFLNTTETSPIPLLKYAIKCMKSFSRNMETSARLCGLWIIYRLKVPWLEWILKKIHIDSGVQPYLFPRLEPILSSEYASLHFHYLYLKSQTYIKYFCNIINIFVICNTIERNKCEIHSLFYFYFLFYNKGQYILSL